MGLKLTLLFIGVALAGGLFDRWYAVWRFRPKWNKKIGGLTEDGEITWTNSGPDRGE